MTNIQTKVRMLGGFGLVSMFLAEPSFIGVLFATTISMLGFVAICYVLYLLGERYNEKAVFNITITQSIIFLPFMALAAYIGLHQDSLNDSQMVTYLLIGALIFLLIFLAYTNYVLSKRIKELSIKADNVWFRYSAILLMVSAYTTPILIGLFVFGLALIVFLLGCVLYRDNLLNE